ncbi:MAG: response regulator [Ruthenibacterium lactatiformans]
MPKAPRIFVVEDDESIRMLLEVALRSSGYTVSAFPNAADALAEMENTVPDAAVLDIMLDGMDGITALKLMRANARLAGVPVMMLTAKDSENDKIIGLDAGADDCDKAVQRAGAVRPCARAAAARRRRARAEKGRRAEKRRPEAGPCGARGHTGRGSAGTDL